MEDKVWFTYKARIQAHQRLESNDLHSQVVLVWYALLSAVLAIFTIRYPAAIGQETDMISAILSVALLVISMLVANRDYRGRALAMRANYLALQDLYSRINGQVTEEHRTQYQSLLCTTENHIELDDKRFRVLHAHTLTSRIPTRREYIEVYFFLILRLITLGLMYIAPPALAFYWVTK